jgi:hypothetical protein
LKVKAFDETFDNLNKQTQHLESNFFAFNKTFDNPHQTNRKPRKQKFLMNLSTTLTNKHSTLKA